jgi:hypothetical protein
MRRFWRLAGALAGWFLLSVIALWLLQKGFSIIGGWHETYEVEVTDYTPPAPEPEDLLADDRLEDKKPPAFDLALVDRRPVGHQGEWFLNTSAAVLRLDVPLIKPDREADLLTLYPSYAAAAGKDPAARAVLPSVNLLDGKAKQFDDGLYAALDQAYYQGLKD